MTVAAHATAYILLHPPHWRWHLNERDEDAICRIAVFLPPSRSSPKTERNYSTDCAVIIIKPQRPLPQPGQFGLYYRATLPHTPFLSASLPRGPRPKRRTTTYSLTHWRTYGV